MNGSVLVIWNDEMKIQWGADYRTPNYRKQPITSSLLWSISLSFYSFLYNGVSYDLYKLSISVVIVIQKGSNGDQKV